MDDREFQQAIDTALETPPMRWTLRQRELIRDEVLALRREVKRLTDQQVAAWQHSAEAGQG